MKTLLTLVKRIALMLVVVVGVVAVPIGVATLHQKARASYLSPTDKQVEDIARLAYLIRHEFGGFAALVNVPAFEAQLTALRARVGAKPVLTTEAFQVELITLMASSRDSHTSVHRFREMLGDIDAFRVEWFGGSFYLTAGRMDDDKWLGSRVTSINGHTPQEAYDKLSAYANSPNPAGRALFMAPFASLPAVLLHEGLTTTRNQASLTVENAAGESRTFSYDAMPRDTLGSLADYQTLAKKYAQAKNSVTLVNEIRRRPWLNSRGRLFTITDRGTGSAAISLTSSMERHTRAILVGDGYLQDPAMAMILSYAPAPERAAPTPPNLPAGVAGTYAFSPLRNLSLSRTGEGWTLAVDGWVDTRVLERDSRFVTAQHGIAFTLPENPGGPLLVRLDGGTITAPRLPDGQSGILKLIDDGKFAEAQTRLLSLQSSGHPLPYLKRALRHSRTYETYLTAGLDQALALNQVNRALFPDDPVVPIIDFELYQASGGHLWGRTKAAFSTIGKLAKRYYRVITTDRIMNDDYNAFIGSQALRPIAISAATSGRFARPPVRLPRGSIQLLSA